SERPSNRWTTAQSRHVWGYGRQWIRKERSRTTARNQRIMVGTGRFELPTPRTPSECSTRLSHVPTQSSRLGGAGFRGLISLHQRGHVRLILESHQPREGRLAFFDQCAGGTNSEGKADPVPKKNSSICSTRNCCACGVQGCSRYSFSSIFCRSTHSAHAALETFL